MTADQAKGAQLEVNSATLLYGGVRALTGLSLSVSPGVVHAVVGPNGAGKTSLFNVISGVVRPTKGRVCLDGRDISQLRPDERVELGMARTFQSVRLFKGMNALENVMVGRHRRTSSSWKAMLLFRAKEIAERRATREIATELLTLVGLDGLASMMAGRLSYAQQRRLEIARALATEPRLLLLDEPTSGMNEEGADQLRTLIRQVQGRGVTILVIEHNMRFVMRVSNFISVLANGTLIAQGPPADVAKDPRVLSAYLGEP